MKYVVSDIHGRYDKYMELLDRLNLRPDDTLYFLGDAIDRGPDGCRILLDMANRPNVVALMGNHEAMMLDALPGILRCIYEDDAMPNKDEIDAAELWFNNGGETTLADYMSLSADEMQCLWDYMKSLPLYMEVAAGGQNFLLLHGGLGNFSPSRPIEEYSRDEIVWCRPKLDTIYYSDNCVVVGHTPVQFMEEGNDPEARIFKADSFIDIDCGCVYENGRLACLCLDTMEEIYI